LVVLAIFLVSNVFLLLDKIFILRKSRAQIDRTTTSRWKIFARHPVSDNVRAVCSPLS